MSLNEQVIELIKAKGALSAGQIITVTGRPRSSVFKALTELVNANQLIKAGSHPQITYSVSNGAPVPQVSQTQSIPIQTIQESSLEPLNPLKRIIIALIVLLILLLGYHLYSYVSSVQQMKQLRGQIQEQADELAQMEVQLLEGQSQLRVRDLELTQMAQEKDDLAVQFKQQNESLIAAQEQIKGLQKQFQELGIQMQNEKDQAIIRLQERDAINEQLRAQIALINQTMMQQNKQLQEQAQELTVLKQANQVPEIIRPVTLEQVVLWSKLGMNAVDIIQRIKAAQGTYSLLPETVKYLRELNVSEEVIKYLLK